MADEPRRVSTEHLHLTCACCGRLTRTDRLDPDVVAQRPLVARTKQFFAGPRRDREGGIAWTDGVPLDQAQALVLRGALVAGLRRVDARLSELGVDAAAAFDEQYRLDVEGTGERETVGVGTGDGDDDFKLEIF